MYFPFTPTTTRGIDLLSAQRLDTLHAVQNDQSSKKWFITAILVGLIVLALGISAVACSQHVADHAPHFWTLLSIGIGGISVSLGLIVWGSYKIHKSPKVLDVPGSLGGRFWDASYFNRTFYDLPPGTFATRYDGHYAVIFNSPDGNLKYAGYCDLPADDYYGGREDQRDTVEMLKDLGYTEHKLKT